MSINGQKLEDVRSGDRDDILLGMLTVIDRDANVSQRMISRELGVALGLANAYLKRCVRKGWIKVQQVPRRRYAYYLTPSGFSEKARLTGQYLSASLTFFRRARSQLGTLLRDCASDGRVRIALAGRSELAEIAVLAAQDHDVSLVALIDPPHAGKRFVGLPVVNDWRDCSQIDAVIVTALDGAEGIFRTLTKEMGEDRVLAPPLLRIGEGRRGSAEAIVQAAK